MKEQPNEPTDGAAKYVTAASMIDCTGAAASKNPVIVLKGRRIDKIGTKDSIKIPQGAEVLDCGSCTLMPGHDGHSFAHDDVQLPDFPQPPRRAMGDHAASCSRCMALFHAQICFDMGFTTLRDLGHEFAARPAGGGSCAPSATPSMPASSKARACWSAAFTTITGSHLDLIQPRAAVRLGFQTADGPWELRKLARTNLLAGCDVIKTCATGGGGTDKEEPDIRNMTQEELDAIVDEAHAFHKHRAGALLHAAGAAHGAESRRRHHRAHGVLRRRNHRHDQGSRHAWMTPTLAHRTDHAIEIRKEIGTSKFVTDKMKKLQPSCFDTFQKMHKAGINIAMGTDMGFEPEMGTNASELAIYVKLGMKPMHAIQTATINAAKAIKMEKDLGTLEAGKLADIVAVNGDPLADIACLQEKKNIQLVMKEGKVYADRRPAGHRRTWSTPSRASWKIIDYL